MKIGDKVKLNKKLTDNYYIRKNGDFNEVFIIIAIVENYVFLNKIVGGSFSNVIGINYLISIKEERKNKLKELKKM